MGLTANAASTNWRRSPWELITARPRALSCSTDPLLSCSPVSALGNGCTEISRSASLSPNSPVIRTGSRLVVSDQCAQRQSKGGTVSWNLGSCVKNCGAHLPMVLRPRMRDRFLLHLIDKWFKAGVMEDGCVMLTQ